MTTFAKKTIPSKFLQNIKSKEVRSQNERNAEKSTSITHQKSTKKNSLQHQKSKTIETKICKEVDGVRKFTTNPYRRFRSKQTRLAVHDESKNYVNTTSHKYVAKTESQKRPPYLHIATGHSKFLICISNSGAIDKHFFTFSEGKIKQTQFYIWQGRVFTLHLSKKIQKLIKKHEVREHLKTQFTAT